MRVGLPVGACRPAARLPDRPVAYLPPAVFLPAALLNRAGVGLARAPVIQHVFHSPLSPKGFSQVHFASGDGRECGCEPAQAVWLRPDAAGVAAGAVGRGMDLASGRRGCERAAARAGFFRPAASFLRANVGQGVLGNRGVSASARFHDLELIRFAKSSSAIPKPIPARVAFTPIPTPRNQ